VVAGHPRKKKSWWDPHLNGKKLDVVARAGHPNISRKLKNGRIVVQAGPGTKQDLSPK
jgi:hypothetical protein